jgi:type I restriction enzyme S subunit
VIDYGVTQKAEPDEIPAEAWVLELEDIEKDTSKVLQRVTFAQRQSKSTKNRFVVGDVLYGKLRPYLNKVIRADQDGYCTTEIVPLKASAAIDGGYLFYWLKHPAFLEYVTSVSHGLNMPRLGTEAGKEAPFVLAPINEQKRIADKLDTILVRVDACRKRLDRVSAILKRFRQAVLTAATSGYLTDEWRETHGATWLKMPFEDLLAKEDGAIRRGPFGSSIKKSFFVSDGYKVYEQKNAIQDDANLGDYFIDEAKFKELEGFSVRSGDFIVSCAGTIGRISQLPVGAKPGVINQALMRVRVDSTVVEDLYFLLLFRSPEFQAQILEQTQGSAMQNMAAIKVIRQILIRLPSLEEQREIVRRVEALVAYADRLEARYTTARAQVERLTPALLAKAFHGELVPQDPNDEPASVLLERIRTTRAAAGEKSARKVRTKRKPMATTLTTDTMKEIIRGLPTDQFTFDDLCRQVSVDYETLKDLVFDLLSEAPAILKQVFDMEDKIMRLVRVR